MIRKLIATLAVVLGALLVVPGTAVAAPTYGGPTISVTYLGDNRYQIDISNFGMPGGADISIHIVVSYGGPNGLRHSAGLAAAAPTETYDYTPDGDGNGTFIVPVSQSGPITITATGNPSGRTASVSWVHTMGADGGATQGVPYYSHSSGQGSGGQGYSADGTSSGAGLAYTGSSIAAPIAIGLVALLAGLALLFFGTRGVARRKALRARR